MSGIPNQLLKNISTIKHLYCEVVHGRYDSVCPYRGAYELKQSWPQLTLTTVNSGGHSSMDKEITRALVKATKKFADQYRKLFV